MVSAERLTALERQWVNLARDRSPTPEQLFQPWDELVRRYSEPHRHYHHLGHIAEVLRAVARLLPPDVDPAPALFATWFHDIVYDPTQCDNELKSVTVAQELLAEFTTPAEQDAIAQYILATRHDESSDDPITTAIMDGDLAILGASEVRYQQYAAAIRREYMHVSDSDYRAGRSRILKRFLERPSIYRHPVMVAEGETSARENISRELAMLQ